MYTYSHAFTKFEEVSKGGVLLNILIHVKRGTFRPVGFRGLLVVTIFTPGRVRPRVVCHRQNALDSRFIQRRQLVGVVVVVCVVSGNAKVSPEKVNYTRTGVRVDPSYGAESGNEWLTVLFGKNEEILSTEETFFLETVGGSKISHSMVHLETCLLDTLALQVNWSGANYWVMARPVACPYMGEWPSSRPQSDTTETTVIVSSLRPACNHFWSRWYPSFWIQHITLGS